MTQGWVQQTSDCSSQESGKIWEMISLVENQREVKCDIDDRLNIIRSQHMEVNDGCR